MFVCTNSAYTFGTILCCLCTKTGIVLYQIRTPSWCEVVLLGVAYKPAHNVGRTVSRAIASSTTLRQFGAHIEYSILCLWVCSNRVLDQMRAELEHHFCAEPAPCSTACCARVVCRGGARSHCLTNSITWHTHNVQHPLLGTNSAQQILQNMRCPNMVLKSAL